MILFEDAIKDINPIIDKLIDRYCVSYDEKNDMRQNLLMILHRSMESYNILVSKYGKFGLHHFSRVYAHQSRIHIITCLTIKKKYYTNHDSLDDRIEIDGEWFTIGDTIIVDDERIDIEDEWSMLVT